MKTKGFQSSKVSKFQNFKVPDFQIFKVPKIQLGDSFHKCYNEHGPSDSPDPKSECFMDLRWFSLGIGNCSATSGQISTSMFQVRQQELSRDFKTSGSMFVCCWFLLVFICSQSLKWFSFICGALRNARSLRNTQIHTDGFGDHLTLPKKKTFRY